jgi:Cu-processing system permease protein
MTMERIRSIALNTYRESIREKLLVIAIFFGGILMASSYMLSPLAVGARNKILLDVGLASIPLLGVLTAVMIGGTLLHKEIERRAVYMVLARPVSRLEYLLGKFWGILAAISSVVAVMTGVMVVTFLLGRVGLRPIIFAAVYLSLLEVAVICSVVVLFSTFTTPILTSFFSLCIFVAGSLSGDLRAFAERFGGEAVKRIVEVFFVALPNLKVFNLRHEAVHDLDYAGTDLGLATIYAVVYCGAALYIAYLIFRRREFA